MTCAVAAAARDFVGSIGRSWSGQSALADAAVSESHETDSRSRFRRRRAWPTPTGCGSNGDPDRDGLVQGNCSPVSTLDACHRTLARASHAAIWTCGTQMTHPASASQINASSRKYGDPAARGMGTMIDASEWTVRELYRPGMHGFRDLPRSPARHVVGAAPNQGAAHASPRSVEDVKSLMCAARNSSIARGARTRLQHNRASFGKIVRDSSESSVMKRAGSLSPKAGRGAGEGKGDQILRFRREKSA